jgi:hypothetical protein
MQELLKLNSAVQQQEGEKEATIGEQQREFNNDL